MISAATALNEAVGILVDVNAHKHAMASIYQGPERSSVVASLYRKDQSVSTLNRIYAVTGQGFPISGDAPLRAAANRMRAAHRAAEKVARERFHLDPTPENLTNWADANERLA